MSLRLASLDIGSNTLRLLIAEFDGTTLRPLAAERRITRLGEQMQPGRALAPAAIKRSIAALQEYRRLMEQYRVAAYAAGATAAVRQAANQDEFLALAASQAGIEIEVLSPEREANLSLLGAEGTLAAAKNSTGLIDIGGGSTEIVWRRPETKAVNWLSLPLGAVTVTETQLTGDPPGWEKYCQCVAGLRQWVTAAPLPTVAGGPWLGTAGTITTLASMHLGLDQYRPERLHGLVLQRQWVEALCRRLAGMTLRERRRLPGLERGREDIILAGGVILVILMEALGCSQLTVSDAGLLEGLLLDLSRRAIGGSIQAHWVEASEEKVNHA